MMLGLGLSLPQRGLKQARGVINAGLLTGAAAGTPGTLPTGWEESGGTGTWSVSEGTQIVDGVECFGITVSGGFIQLLIPDGYGGVPASPDDAFDISAYVQVVSGTLDGVSLAAWEIDSGFGYLGDVSSAKAVPTAPAFSDCLLNHSGALTNASTARTNGYIYLEAAGTTTVRLSARFTVS